MTIDFSDIPESDYTCMTCGAEVMTTHCCGHIIAGLGVQDHCQACVAAGRCSVVMTDLSPIDRENMDRLYAHDPLHDRYHDSLQHDFPPRIGNNPVVANDPEEISK